MAGFRSMDSAANRSFLRAFAYNVFPSSVQIHTSTWMVFYYLILIFEFFFKFWYVFEQRSSSLTFGERICAACIPLIAIIEAVVITVANCFEYRLPVPKCRFDVEDLARLAAESQCDFLFSSFNLVSGCKSWFLICLRAEKFRILCFVANYWAKSDA